MQDQLKQLAWTAANLELAASEGKITPEQFLDIIDDVKRAAKLLSKVVDHFEGNLKATLEATGEPVAIGNRLYTYKVTSSRVFDAAKAKKQLTDLEFNLDDFYKTQDRKALDFTLIQ